MLRWAFAFCILSIISAVFGFGDIAPRSADIARVLFFLFIVMFVVSLIWGLFEKAPRSNEFMDRF